MKWDTPWFLTTHKLYPKFKEGIQILYYLFIGGRKEKGVEGTQQKIVKQKILIGVGINFYFHSNYDKAIDGVQIGRLGYQAFFHECPKWTPKFMLEYW